MVAVDKLPHLCYTIGNREETQMLYKDALKLKIGDTIYDENNNALKICKVEVDDEDKVVFLHCIYNDNELHRYSGMYSHQGVWQAPNMTKRQIKISNDACMEKQYRRKIDRIDNFCERLKNQWKRYPDFRFGQMMINMFYSVQQHEDPFYTEDDKMIEYIEEEMDKLLKKA